MTPATKGPSRVRRRDGTVTAFDASRIARAVQRAAQEVGRDPGVIPRVTDRARWMLTERFPGGTPGIEDVQEVVERALMQEGLADVARAYVVHRARRAELRDGKRMLGVRDELELSLGAVAALAARYLRRDETGKIVESTGEMMDRVARHVAQAEDVYRPGAAAEWAEAFSATLRALEFLPNSPTLMNAGTELGMLSACFVLPVEDSLESIFGALATAARVQQAGGGTGFSFSRVRPAGDLVASTHGVARGPLSFVHVFDVATDVIRQGGRRRGANMAVLDVSHPDIGSFVEAKAVPGRLGNFNLSVGASDRFMRAATVGGTHRLVNPRTGRVVTELPAADLLAQIATAAWRTGEPGIVFLDRVNRANPVPAAGRIEATNPCGEVPLLPGESCNLGSVNLARFVDGGRIDWARLAATTRVAVRFLDDVIEVNRYPAPELEEAARATRKVGLGFMGLAELLAARGIPYDSDDALRLAGRLARRIRTEARRASAELAAERGAFPRFDDSIFARRGAPLRNAQLTSVAPTGTISLIAGTTSGIEPMFAIAYMRKVLGRHLVEANPLFERTARDRGFHSDALMARIAREGTIPGDGAVPGDVRAAFRTALEIPPAWHLRMQAAVQRHVDASVSKTVNLPREATPADVASLFVEAWNAGVKGMTVYRYGSRPEQVLSYLGEERPVEVDADFTGGCAGWQCEF